MRRRDFIRLLGGAAVWPLAARAQQPAMPVMPVIGYLGSQSPDVTADYLRGFHQGLKDGGYIEDQTVLVDYRWAQDQTDRLPALAADLVRRRVAVIAASGGPAAESAAKATTSIPIVFMVAEDPVRMGLVASLARPGGNATGINTFSREVVAKRLRLLNELVPKAARIAVIVNPTNTATAEPMTRDVHEAATTIGLQIQILNAATIGEIDAAFATLARERPDALYVAPDSFFTSRRGQFATLTARDRIPAAYSQRDFVSAGGLMSYGTDIPDMFRQMGVYTGKILKGARPADLPVMQPTKFEFVINLWTAKALDLNIPDKLLAIADELIE
jgi:putative ABC transport system substrate-binding protein